MLRQDDCLICHVIPLSLPFGFEGRKNPCYECESDQYPEICPHQHPHYPGTGAAHEKGGHNNVVNCPLAPGTDGGGFRTAFERDILPALDTFAPDLVLISAGFDAHKDDPLSDMGLEEEDFFWVTRRIMAVADRHAKGRVVSALEGGYNLRALGASVAAHVSALMMG